MYGDAPTENEPARVLVIMIGTSNFLPIFLYDFIGISLEIVGGMGYWCFGLVVWVGNG